MPQCREVFFQSLEDGREIRQADVRSVDISRFLEVACQLVALHVTEELDTGGVVATVSHREPDLAAVAASVSRSRRGGRRQIPDAKLTEVAEVYKANRRRPTKAVEEAFGIAPRTASLYVRRARVTPAFSTRTGVPTVASIAKRPDGRWRGRYRDAAGREHARHFTGRPTRSGGWTRSPPPSWSAAYVDPAAGR